MKIYTLVEAVPSRMQAVARLLFASGPLPREQALALLQPRESGTGLADSTVAACSPPITEMRAFGHIQSCRGA